jgi:hypothetical protein
MSLSALLLLIVIAAVCGAIGKAIAGRARGGTAGRREVSQENLPRNAVGSVKAGKVHSRRVNAAAFALAFLLTTSARAQQDRWSTAVRSLSDAHLGTFQGTDCVSIHAPRSIVWRLLVAPEYAAAWFFADSPKLKPRGARYKDGLTAHAGDVLTLQATTSEGPRHVDLSVIVAAPPGLLSFLVRSDEAGILDKGIEQVSFTFGLESVLDDVTDLYLVSHYDSNSPFAAILSQVAAHHQHQRRLAILEMLRLLAEEAARLKDPPLHEVALSVPPPPVYKTLSSRR